MATYVVQGGDNLSKIAQKTLGDASRWREIYEANKGNLRSGNANLIFPGESLTIPGSGGSQPSSSTAQSSPQNGQPQTIEQIIKQKEDETKRLIQEQLDFLKDFLKDNPFAFDESMARVAAESKYRPYFEEQLSDFINPLQDKIQRSTEDQSRILGELVRRRELGETQKTREIMEGLEKSRGGFVGRGLFGSGVQKRDTAMDEIKGTEELSDFLTRSRFEEEGTAISGERERTDLGTDINQKQRDIFGTGREFDTSVAKELETKRMSNASRYGLRAEEAYQSRFGSPFVGSSGQSVTQYLSGKVA